MSPSTTTLSAALALPAAAGGTAITPLRIGVLFGELGKLNLVALKYLIVHLNTLQSSLEFEVLPVEGTDEVITLLGRKERLDREHLRTLLPAFRGRVGKKISAVISERKLTQTSVPDDFLLITLARFSDGYYGVSVPHVRVLALGDWDAHMAPPSLLDAMVTIILRQAIGFASPSLRGSVHYGTRGCLFDFTDSLDEARFKTLQGFICSECRAALSKDGQDQLAADALRASNTGAWLGKSDDPTSPAGVVAHLGYDMFLTRGVSPSWLDKLRSTLVDEGFKECLKVVFAVLLAVLLLWLGLKAPEGHTPVGAESAPKAGAGPAKGATLPEPPPPPHPEPQRGGTQSH